MASPACRENPLGFLPEGDFHSFFVPTKNKNQPRTISTGLIGCLQRHAHEETICRLRSKTEQLMRRQYRNGWTKHLRLSSF